MNICENYLSGERGTSNADALDNNFRFIDASAPGAFLDANDDLNSFSAPDLYGINNNILPFADPNEILLRQWDNGGVLQVSGAQGFPSSVQIPSIEQVDTSRSMGNTSCTDPEYTVATEMQPATTVPEPSHSSENSEKPKRGRPRKRKMKNPLTEEQRQRKREAFLDRNRLAASKCRKRKKESIEKVHARARSLDRESRILTAEVICMRAEHTKWLKLAIEHTKSCPDGCKFKADLKAAEARFAELANCEPPIRENQEWDNFLANREGASTTTGSSVSMSSKDCETLSRSELGYFDATEYERNTMVDADGSILATISRRSSYQVAPEYTETDRESFTSNAENTEAGGSSKDSAYCSPSPTTPLETKFSFPDAGPCRLG